MGVVSQAGLDNKLMEPSGRFLEVNLPRTNSVEEMGVLMSRSLSAKVKGSDTDSHYPSLRRACSARTTQKRRNSALDENNQRKYRAMSVMEFASKINQDFVSRLRRLRKMFPSKLPFDYEQTKEKLKYHL